MNLAFLVRRVIFPVGDELLVTWAWGELLDRDGRNMVFWYGVLVFGR